jgi:chromosomal replication initiator protein
LNSNLAARLSGGLTVRLPLPEFETRVTILARMAEAKGARITDEAIRTLAESLAESPLALQGAIMHLQTISGAAEIDQASVEAYLAQRGGPRTLTLRDIAVAAARHFSLPLTALRGNSRRKSVVAARGAAMWLSRQITDASLEQIGVFFGGRDHTTVLHACRRTEGLAATDRETRRAVDEIQVLLGITP